MPDPNEDDLEVEDEEDLDDWYCPCCEWYDNGNESDFEDDEEGDD